MAGGQPRASPAAEPLEITLGGEQLLTTTPFVYTRVSTSDFLLFLDGGPSWRFDGGDVGWVASTVWLPPLVRGTARVEQSTHGTDHEMKDLDPLFLGYHVLCWICVVPIRSRERVLDHSDRRLSPGDTICMPYRSCTYARDISPLKDISMGR